MSELARPVVAVFVALTIVMLVGETLKIDFDKDQGVIGIGAAACVFLNRRTVAVSVQCFGEGQTDPS